MIYSEYGLNTTIQLKEIPITLLILFCMYLLIFVLTIIKHDHDFK